MGQPDPEQTYDSSDLANWDYSGDSLAVVGFPVRHSISPAMHNAAIAELAKSAPEFANWRYFRFEIEPERLADALPLFFARGFIGLNLTVPHKEVALPLVEEVDPDALEIGAVNTLKRSAGGFRGYNTDGYGLSKGVEEDLGATLAGNSIAILGAGGAARAAAVQSLRSGCRSLVIVNRSQDRLDGLLESLRPIATETGIRAQGFQPGDPDLKFPENPILINATSLGLRSGDPLPLPDSSLPESALLYDMIYNPSSTRLMELVSAKGGRSANGLSMLVHQGAKALEIWSGRAVSADTMRAAADAALDTQP